MVDNIIALWVKGIMMVTCCHMWKTTLLNKSSTRKKGQHEVGVSIRIQVCKSVNLRPGKCPTRMDNGPIL